VSNAISVWSRRGAAPGILDAMSLVQLQSFVAVAETQHLGRAAVRLRITQPPLTRRIRALEEELGVVLFERTPHGMRLASAGERLLPRARTILAAVDEARSALSPCPKEPDDGRTLCSCVPAGPRSRARGGRLRG
jgi:DNA-binding transcriptional LysR family regulator